MSEANDKNENHGFLLGLIVGGAIGAAISYFLNSEDKEKALIALKEKAGVLLENFGEFKEDFVDKTQEIKEEVEEKTQEIIEEVKELPQTVKQTVEKAVEENKMIPPNKKGFGKSFFKKGTALKKE